jgi:cytochrome c biogenesis protein CcmG, thiol:disulfide interchange protein DsbE
MTDAPLDAPSPPGPVPEVAPGGTAPPTVRPPRKRFIFIGLGIGLLIILIVGLTTSVGTSPSTPPAPRAGGPVPSFTRPNVGPSGAARVSVPGDGVGSGTPAVLLFFGNWCPGCHQELPPLAAAVRAQTKARGALAHVRVIGVDSEDAVGKAKSFIQSAGVTFPVAYDQDASVLSGLFYFRGDPYAVFVDGDGTINKIVRGDGLTPASFTADERALLANKSA